MQTVRQSHGRTRRRRRSLRVGSADLLHDEFGWGRRGEDEEEKSALARAWGGAGELVLYLCNRACAHALVSGKQPHSH